MKLNFDTIKSQKHANNGIMDTGVRLSPFGKYKSRSVLRNA
jgi:hypothetical protein